MSDLQGVLERALEESGADVVAAYLFGSHAAGRAHAESDIDVGVLLDRAVLPDRGARARRAVLLASALFGRNQSVSESVSVSVSRQP